ncbi:hypothetical protein [Cupriavidus consociatus]|uniref:hypothetical protein n=1 Tax=Cupriavidus consociatus TaxID=2821357 RepID=UPI001AE0E991|nr:MULTISPECIES: hypothetical protein [unclassified Cupriavidus]MBP0622929.1 hypothetical protein [Cupriavidus sp. LEh25]MDK2659617.1 hypothetical protein [Cupriavidus sp. LEh21]
MAELTCQPLTEVLERRDTPSRVDGGIKATTIPSPKVASAMLSIRKLLDGAPCASVSLIYAPVTGLGKAGFAIRLINEHLRVSLCNHGWKGPGYRQRND